MINENQWQNIVSAAIRQKSEISSSNFHEQILVQAIYRYTNRARREYNLPLFLWNDTLAQTAHDHSFDMVRNHYLSHYSPDKDKETLHKRLKNHNFYFTNHTFAENIGVDYMLNIAGKPYYEKTGWSNTSVYINYETGEPIKMQTYEQFAKGIVEKWMDSPGHRRNILNPELNQIGIGAIPGKHQNFDAIYVTQVFLGRIDIQIRKKKIPNHIPQSSN